MNYLKIKIEPIGCKRIHHQLERAFVSYMLGRGWILRINKNSQSMKFYSIGRNGKQLNFEIDRHVDMRHSAKIEYHNFLKAYLLKGNQFLIDLEESLKKILKKEK